MTSAMRVRPKRSNSSSRSAESRKAAGGSGARAVACAPGGTTTQRRSGPLAKRARAQAAPGVSARAAVAS